MANYVVIPAAGTGSRMEASKPKQYLPLLNKPLMAHCLQTFSESDLIDHVFVVLSADDADWETHMAEVPVSDKVSCLRCGGETRAQTVLNGLHAINTQVKADDWILVHDAARPGLNEALLAKLINTLNTDEIGGLLALPLADTLKKMQADNDQAIVQKTIPRAGLWQAQTPQMFRYGMLKEALAMPQATPTDEAQAIENMGYQPKLVTGALCNLKVTYPQDLAVVAALIQTEDCA